MELGEKSRGLASSRWIFADLVAFLVLISYLSLGGAVQVFPAELAIAVFGVVVCLDPKLRSLVSSRMFVRLLAACLLWASGTLVSGLAQGNGLSVLVEGVLRPMVVGFAAIAMAGVINSPARRPLRRLVVALSLAGFLGYSLQPSTFARDEVWKFGVGLAVTFLVVGLMSNFRPRSFAVALLALGVAHFLLAYRSLALICAAAAFAVFLMVRHREIDRRADQAAKRSSWRLAALATFTVVSAVSIVSQYDQLATSGYLGDKQQQKAMALTSDTGSSLLTGRVEWLVSVYSIGESPVLGNGTGLPPPRDAVVSAYHQYQEWGLTTVATAIISDPPAYHSQILGSLAENGVAAIPFWVLFGWLAWRAFSTGLIDRLSASELNVAIFLMTLTAWNSLFSPFGSGHRLLLAIIFGVFIALENQRERGCRAAS